MKIISTRNLYGIYGVDLLVEAAPMILKKIEADFVICGDGPERKRLERKARSLGLAGRFSFRGRLSAERLAHDFVEGLEGDARFRLTAVHPSFVQGPLLSRKHLRSSPALVRTMLRGKMPAVPRISLVVVDVRDVAEAHVRALEVDDPAGRYICANEPIWMKDVSRILARHFPDHPLPTRQMPDLMAYAGSLFTKQLSMHFLRRNLGRVRLLDNRRIRQDLGLTFRPLEETLVDGARSMIAQGWL